MQVTTKIRAEYCKAARDKARRRAPDLVCRVIPPEVSLVKELIRERRELWRGPLPYGRRSVRYRVESAGLCIGI